MKKHIRRLAWVGVALCVVALAFGVTVRAIGPGVPGLTEANVRRVSRGMSVAEVEHLLGRPADYSFFTGSAEEGTYRIGGYVWRNEKGHAFVHVDEHALVDEARWLPADEEELTSLERFRRWLDR